MLDLGKKFSNLTFCAWHVYTYLAEFALRIIVTNMRDIFAAMVEFSVFRDSPT